jgi:hypothetical protein
MRRKVRLEFSGCFVKLASSTPVITTLEMIQSRRNLNERLEKSSIGVPDLMPQVLPHFVGFKELLPVEEQHAFFKPRIPLLGSIHD